MGIFVFFKFFTIFFGFTTVKIPRAPRS